VGINVCGLLFVVMFGVWRLVASLVVCLELCLGINIFLLELL